MKNKKEAVAMVLVEIFFSMICFYMIGQATNPVIAAAAVVSVAAIAVAITLGVDVINSNAGAVGASAAIAATIIAVDVAGAANIFTDAVLSAILLGAIAGIGAVVFSRAETKGIVSIIWVILLWFTFAFPFFIGTIFFSEKFVAR